jgi:hypothetical protein
LWPFGIFYGYFVCFSRFGMLYQEKFGNPGWRVSCNPFHLICHFNDRFNKHTIEILQVLNNYPLSVNNLPKSLPSGRKY